VVATCNRADHYIFALLFLSSIFFLFLAYSQRPQIGCLPYFHTWCGLSVNLECRSEMCCTRLAGNTGRKNDAKKSPSAHHRTTLSGYIFATEAHIDNRKKYLLSSNIFPTCSYNMVNFGPLAAALLHSQTAALSRGRHLYSAGRPLLWALAHISSSFFFPSLFSAVADWMSTILPHMTWSSREFRMHA